MKAVRIHSHGNSDVLSIDDISEPVCEPQQVIIEMKAWALNHLDLWVRKGFGNKNALELPLILGSDGSGFIVEKGSKVKGWDNGDEVVIQPGLINDVDKSYFGHENLSNKYGILGETHNGVQSEYIALDITNIYRKASHLSFVEAASMQLVFMTAYEMLVQRAHLSANETVLIYGGCSGVGSAAIQIASDIGAKVIVTAGSKVKIEYLKKLGLDKVLSHNDNDLLTNLREITNGKGVDVVFEHIGSNTWSNSLKILNKGGRIVTCGATTGSKVNIDLTHLFIKQQSLIGSTMAGMASFIKVMNKIKNKKYTPIIDKVFKLEEVKLAHEHIENRLNIGKVVLNNE